MGTDLPAWVHTPPCKEKGDWNGRAFNAGWCFGYSFESAYIKGSEFEERVTYCARSLATCWFGEWNWNLCRNLGITQRMKVLLDCLSRLL